MSEHQCRESKTCCCSLTALEPSDDCPQHGAGPWPPRCAICGRFLPRSVRELAFNDEALKQSVG